MVTFDEIQTGIRLLAGLPAIFGDPITPHAAAQTLRRRLQHRDEDFLAVLRTAVFRDPTSPYYRLLDAAGCEYADVERLVRADGIEETLRGLYRAGVYLEVDEIKGRRPVVRGSLRFEVQPADLRNAASRVRLPVRTSGSRSGGIPVPIDIRHIREWAVDTCLLLHAASPDTRWAHADWEVPGAGAVIRQIEYGSLSDWPLEWFSQVDPRTPGLHPRYRWSVRLVRWGGYLGGRALPRPTYVPVDRAEVVASWMRAQLRAGRTPHVFTFASSAVRVCEAAASEGIDVTGGWFTLIGEPTTAARLRVIRAAGARGVPRYSSIETGPVAFGCLNPTASDDMHVLGDLYAVIQPHPDAPGRLPAGALLVSSLRSTTAMVFLNVSLGDLGTLSPRSCGCSLEALGWPLHLHSVRSYEKLTAAGMTFLDTDVIRVLEEILPACFGGGPTHYQLVEDSGSAGEPRLRLLIDPAVGPVSEDKVVQAFLTAIAPGSGAERVMSMAWARAGVLRVERCPPITEASGKILHLHVHH
ncbi:MAG TPA: hypothetical protein VGK88_00865 [bacterium]